MNNAQKIDELVKQVGKSVQIFEKKLMLGFIPVTLRRGWLHIEDVDDYWAVTLTDDKTAHNLFNGPAFGADFRKDNGERKTGPLHLTGAWKSAVSMWPIRNEKEIDQVFNFVSSRIDLAFHFYSNASA